MPRSVPFTETDHGLDLAVRLTPKSSRDAIEGVEYLANGAAVLKVRVRAVPEDNKANKALIKLLAKELSQPRTEMSLVGGQKARIKRIRIAGNSQDIAQCIAARLAQMGG